MRTTVVVPTYNERENIGELLRQLLALPVSELSVLVVDDASPDGTAEVVRAAAARTDRVRLLSRPQKDGLGAAYTAAFSALLGREPQNAFSPDTIVQMDADLSHNPNDVPRLLRALADADLVVGSRYVRGGGTQHWNFGRRLLSRSANVVARTLTRSPVHDLTGGFNAWRRGLLRTIAPWTMRAEGYGYLLELKVRAARSGARITEVPITFVERRAGQSKFSKAVIWEAAGVVLRLAARGRQKK